MLNRIKFFILLIGWLLHSKNWPWSLETLFTFCRVSFAAMLKIIITTNNSRKNQQILKDFLAHKTRRQAEVLYDFNKMQIFSLFQLTHVAGFSIGEKRWEVQVKSSGNKFESRVCVLGTLIEGLKTSQEYSEHQKFSKHFKVSLNFPRILKNLQIKVQKVQKVWLNFKYVQKPFKSSNLCMPKPRKILRCLNIRTLSCTGLSANKKNKKSEQDTHNVKPVNFLRGNPSSLLCLSFPSNCVWKIIFWLCIFSFSFRFREEKYARKKTNMHD